MALGGSIWSVIGIDPTNDEREIRRAYARRLKEVHPEDDPKGFQDLREAHDSALNLARRGWAVPVARKSPVQAETGTPLDAAPDPADGWSDETPDRWAPQADEPAGSQWGDDADRRWEPSGDAGAPPRPSARTALDPEIRAELDAEQARNDAHAALCDALAVLVAKPELSGGDATALMLRIFRSPAMDSLQVHLNTEYWLARTIAYGGPSADSMIEPAVSFFGWDNAPVGMDISHAIPVLRRRETAFALQQLARPMAPGHDAWNALRARQTRLRRIADRLDLNLDRRVAELLQRIHQDLPALESHLDPDTVAAWRARLARPRFSALFLLFLLIGPPIVAAFVIAIEAFGPAGLLNALALWAVLLSVLTGIGALWVRAVLEPSQAWQSGDPWYQPHWLRFGWAPASLALLTGSAFTPGNSLLWLLFVAIGIGIAGWARVVTSHIPSPAPSRFRLAEFVGILPVLVFAALVPKGSGTLVATLFCTALTFRFGGHALVDEWLSLPAGFKRQASIAHLGAAIGVAAIACSAAVFGQLILASGLVCAFAMADRALALDRFEPLLSARRQWLVFGWVPSALGAAFPIWPTPAVGAIAMLAVYLCVAGVMTGLAGLVTDRGFGRKKRREAGQLA